MLKVKAERFPGDPMPFLRISRKSGRHDGGPRQAAERDSAGCGRTWTERFGDRTATTRKRPWPQPGQRSISCFATRRMKSPATSRAGGEGWGAWSAARASHKRSRWWAEDSKPKWRMRLKPGGSTCCRKTPPGTLRRSVMRRWSVAGCVPTQRDCESIARNGNFSVLTL